MSDKSRQDLLKSLIKRGSVLAEVGVWKGDLSAFLLDATAPRCLYLVDPWQFMPEYSDSWFGSEAVSQATMDDHYAAVIERFKHQIDQGQVVVHRARSVEVIIHERIDLVYIDGLHTREAVYEDILHWGPQVAESGVLVFDDYGLPGWWEDGVKKAVSEAERKGLLEIVDVTGFQAVARWTGVNVQNLAGEAQS